MTSVNSWIKYVKCECNVKKNICNRILFENKVFLCSTCNNYYTLFPYEEKKNGIQTSVTSKILKVTSVGAVFHCYSQGETKDENLNYEKRYAFFEDHKIALTRDEKKSIGDSQPFMLPPRTLNVANNLKHIDNGRDLTDEEIGKMIHGCNITQEEAFSTVKKARKNFKLYSESYICIGRDLCFSRHFVDFIFTKKIENENLIDTVETLMREKMNRTFKSAAIKQKYSNTFNWIQGGASECSLNWHIDLKDTIVDDASVEKNLQSHNYFCSKELPDVCNNAYHTIRKLRFIPLSDIEKKMNAFQECFAHCDLSQWNGIEGLKQFKKMI